MLEKRQPKVIREQAKKKKWTCVQFFTWGVSSFCLVGWSLLWPTRNKNEQLLHSLSHTEQDRKISPNVCTWNPFCNLHYAMHADCISTDRKVFAKRLLCRSTNMYKMYIVHEVVATAQLMILRRTMYTTACWPRLNCNNSKINNANPRLINKVCDCCLLTPKYLICWSRAAAQPLFFSHTLQCR